MADSLTARIHARIFDTVSRSTMMREDAGAW